jgi:hypothetical protein
MGIEEAGTSSAEAARTVASCRPSGGDERKSIGSGLVEPLCSNSADVFIAVGGDALDVDI